MDAEPDRATPSNEPGQARKADPAQPDPLAELRHNVHFLGEQLGAVLQEQGGAVLLETVERIRKQAISLREQESPDLAPLAREVSALDPDAVFDVVRAFHVYFHLINLAEQEQRLHTLR